MATVPVTRTWVAGEVVTAGYMNNNVTAPVGWLLAPAILRTRQTAVQSVATGGVGSRVLFETEDVDSTGMHSTVSNTSRATAVYPGWYRTGGGFTAAANATGQRVLDWFVNGAVINGSAVSWQGFTGLSNRSAARSILVYLNVGDFLEMNFFHNVGASLSSSATGGEQSSMDINWQSN